MTQVNDALSGSKPSASADKSVGRLGRGSVANFGGAVLSAATNFGVTVAITRGMSRSDAGVFFSCTSLFLLAVAVGQLGTSTGLVYFLSRARTLGEPQLLMGYLRAARTPVIVASFLMGIVLVVFAPVIAGWTNPQHVEAATVYLRVLGVFTPFASIKTLNLSASRGMGTMRPTVMLEQIGRPLLQFILVSAVVLLHAIALLPYAWAVCFVLGAAGGNRLLKQKMEKSGPRTARPRPVTREFWTFTWPRAAANVAQIAIQRFDIVLVGAIAGAGPAAVYTASTRFLVLGQLGNRAVSMSAQPRLAEALARGRRSDVNHIYQTSTAWLMISTWPIYLMFAIVGGPLLEVFGKGYSTGGRPLLALLAVAMLIATGCGMVDSVLNMAGRTWWNLMNVAIAFGVNLGVDLWLIPRLGILGAAIGWAAAIVTQNAFSLLMVGIKVKVHPFGRATLSVAAGSLVCFGLVPWVTLLVLGEGIRTVVVSGAIGVVLYAGFLWTFRRLLQLQALISVKRPKKGGRRGGVADGSSAQPEGRSQLQPQTPDDDS